MKRLIVTIGIITFCFSANASAMKKGRSHAQFKKIISELELTEDQKLKFKEMRKKNQMDMKEAHNTANSAATAFTSAVESNKPDRDIKAAHDRMVDAESNIKKIRFSKLLSLREILTDQQKDLLKKHLLKMKKKRGKR